VPAEEDGEIPHQLESLTPIPAGERVPLRSLLPHEIAGRFGHLGIDLPAARRIFAAAVGSHPRDPSRVRGIRHAVMDAVMAASSLALPRVEERTRAADGFAKYLFALEDGARVEAVWIPLERPRASVCLSSMAGCPLACAFCATGRLEHVRNLTAQEMVGQFLRVRAESPRPVSSAVFMGMGEPLLNYDAVVRAAYVLSAPGGGGISAKAISIGTAGVVPGIRRLTAEGHPFRLIVSLTAADPDKRAALMPHETRWPLSALAEALRERAGATGIRVTVAWVMIRGVNTGNGDVEDLRRLLGGIPLIVDLIDVQDPSGRFLPPDDAERERFRDRLTAVLGQPVIRRYSGGAEIGAACGMLAGRGAAEPPPAPGLPGGEGGLTQV
jgi:23S rRNA (adenine2503-C2)-methyltransferase